MACFSSGEDFEVETGIFTLAPGNSSVFLPVSVLEDDYVEYDEQWTVTISQQDASFPPLTIPFTISDNDRMFTYPFLVSQYIRKLKSHCV